MTDTVAEDAKFAACLEIRAREDHERQAEAAKLVPVRPADLIDAVLACADLSRAWNPRHALPSGLARLPSDLARVELEFRGEGDATWSDWEAINSHVCDRYAYLLWSHAAWEVRSNGFATFVTELEPRDDVDRAIHPLFCKLVEVDVLDHRRVGPPVARQLAELRARLMRAAPHLQRARYQIGQYFAHGLLPRLLEELERRARASEQGKPLPNAADAGDASRAIAAPTEPLSDVARAIAQILCEIPPAEGRTATQLEVMLGDLPGSQFWKYDEYSIRARYIKELRPWGVENKQPAGYYIPEDRRPALLRFLGKSPTPHAHNSDATSTQ
jgi:hypothetical protein